MFRLAFWVFVLFLALSFFGISIQAIIASPAGQENVRYLAFLLAQGWHWILDYAYQVAAAASRLSKGLP